MVEGLHKMGSGLSNKLRQAIFLDRDGVICVNRLGYVKSWDEFEFLPGSLDALRQLAELGLVVVVVSNQSAIGRGLMNAAQVEDINNRMNIEVVRAGGRIDGIYICPHHPEDQCDCRKPKPGMVLQAADDLSLSLKNSYLVGDAQSDVQAAKAAGVKPILVLTGRGRSHLSKIEAVDGRITIKKDLAEVVTWLKEKLFRDGSNG